MTSPRSTRERPRPGGSEGTDAILRRLAADGLRLAGLGLRAAAGSIRLAGRGLRAAGRLAGVAPEPAPRRPTARRPAAGPAPPAPPRPRPEPGRIRPSDAAPPRTAPTVPATEPGHVTEEAVLAGEYAEPGAEEGPGPEVGVDEPWDGYDSMKADDIRRRLRRADRTMASAVALYESAHKQRKSILQAADRASRGARG